MSSSDETSISPAATVRRPKSAPFGRPGALWLLDLRCMDRRTRPRRRFESRWFSGSVGSSLLYVMETQCRGAFARGFSTRQSAATLSRPPPRSAAPFSRAGGSLCRPRAPIAMAENRFLVQSVFQNGDFSPLVSSARARGSSSRAWGELIVCAFERAFRRTIFRSERCGCS